MDAGHVVLPDIHVHLDGLYALPLLREVEGEEHHEDVIVVDVHLGKMVRCEAILYSEIVEAEDLPQEPPMRALLSPFCAGYVAPDEGPRVGQMVGQLCGVQLCSEFARTLQNDHINIFGPSAFHSEQILQVTVIKTLRRWCSGRLRSEERRVGKEC